MSTSNPTKLKYRMQTPPKAGVYRLTLTASAFALAVAKGGPITGFAAFPRFDGKWDVMVSSATGDQLNQQRLDGEHLTDVVTRILGVGK